MCVSKYLGRNCSPSRDYAELRTAGPENAGKLERQAYTHHLGETTRRRNSIITLQLAMIKIFRRLACISDINIHVRAAKGVEAAAAAAVADARRGSQDDYMEMGAKIGRKIQAPSLIK